MDSLFRPAEGPAESLCSPRPAIARIEYSVVTKIDCSLAWNIFSRCEEWNRYLKAYENIRWLGEPWAAGSRLLIELNYPTSAVQNRIITVCNPPRCVAWINHVLGYTMEQWVLFDPHSGGGTRISTWVEFTGPTMCIEGHDVVAVIRDFVERWYSNFRDECDRRVSWA